MEIIKRLARSPAAVVGLLLLLLVVAMALSAPIVFPRDPLSLAGRPLQWPFANVRFWLGTDTTGRDIAAQIFHGARISLLIGLVATVLAITIGIVLGALAGYYGGIVDDVLMRITEAFQTVPGFLLALAFVSLIGASLPVVILAIALGAWTGPARLARAEVLTIRERDYVAAARVIGMRPVEIAFREILPNALPPVLALPCRLLALRVPAWA